MKISKTEQNRLRRLEERKPPPEDSGAAVERLKARLEAMARRAREAPDWTEPGPAEIEALWARLAEHGVRRPEVA